MPSESEEARVNALRRASATLLAKCVPRERIRRLNEAPTRADGSYVLLWVQAAHRATSNEALEVAVDRANARGVPVIALFCSTANYPEANERHVGFMFEGLCELEATLRKRRISLYAAACAPPEAIVKASDRACEVVVDGAYLRLLRRWREDLAKRATCAVTEVEGECVVPQLGSSTRTPEISAATFRPKVLPLVERYTRVPCSILPYIAGSLGDDVRRVFESTLSEFDLLPLEDGVDACLAVLDRHGLIRDPRCPRVTTHVGGESRAKAKLDAFLTTGMLARYHHSRNDPTMCLQSHLSPHLHYGQISVVEVARKALAFRNAHKEDTDICASVDVFLDELIVRRELAVNFALRNEHYDAFEGLPTWCKETLEKHKDDPRQWVYTVEEFERGATHDKLWNASQRQLVQTGKQHNYLRMYWGKKILEWSASPEEAWRIAMMLNNRYSLDGRNMVSLTGVGWCFGLHDREFHEVNVTGTIRRFGEAGMKKKFPAGMKGYLDRWGDDDDGNGSSRKRQMRLEDMFVKRSRG